MPTARTHGATRPWRRVPNLGHILPPTIGRSCVVAPGGSIYRLVRAAMDRQPPGRAERDLLNTWAATADLAPQLPAVKPPSRAGPRARRLTESRIYIGGEFWMTVLVNRTIHVSNRFRFDANHKGSAA